MVRFASAVIAVVAAFAVGAQAEDNDYFRPSFPEASGVPGNNAKYHRSPCPALNTLANHGYIPRDGKELTPAILKKAIVDVYRCDETFANTLVGTVPDHFDLSYLSRHEVVAEHDASLVHTDSYWGENPMDVNATLVDTLISYKTEDNTLTKEELKSYRLDREAQCKEQNPEFGMSLKFRLLAGMEAAAMELVFGGGEPVNADNVHTFLSEERLPEGFFDLKNPVTLADVQKMAFFIEDFSAIEQALLSHAFD